MQNQENYRPDQAELLDLDAAYSQELAKAQYAPDQDESAPASKPGNHFPAVEATTRLADRADRAETGPGD